MKKRQSYFMNFPTSSLITILEQRQKELDDLTYKIENNKVKKTIDLKKRQADLEFIINVVKELLIERYMQADVSINECSQIVLYGKGTKKELFKDILTYQLIKKQELVDVCLVKDAINELELQHLQMIIHTIPDTIYARYANNRFDEIIFGVSNAVYEELVKKMIMDRKEG